MKLTTVAAASLALALSVGVAVAQPANSLKDHIVGTWNFVVAEVTAPDGKKSYPFGETPKGILIFTADGHFAQIHVASDVPKIASNSAEILLRIRTNEFLPSLEAKPSRHRDIRWVLQRLSPSYGLSPGRSHF